MSLHPPLGQGKFPKGFLPLAQGRPLKSLLLRVWGKPWGFCPLNTKLQEIAA